MRGNPTQESLIGAFYRIYSRIRESSPFGFLVLTACYWSIHIPLLHSIGRLIADAGKELVIPRLIASGAVLHRDVFWPYGPFSPYFSTMLIGLFGWNLDTFLWLSRVLGYFLCITFLVTAQKVRSPKDALLPSLAVIAFSTTSNYFAWPYSFSNLWATLLGIAGVLNLVHAASAESPTKRRRHLVLAGLVTGWISLCKFIIAFPLIVAAVGTIFVVYRSGALTGREARNSILTYSTPAIFLFACVNGALAMKVGLGTLMFQGFAGFHAIHLRHEALYDRLREVVFLQNGLSMSTASAALAVFICPVIVCVSIGAWVRLLLKLPKSDLLLKGTPVVLFGSGNLLQINSSVHAPYVFPASLLCLVWAIEASNQSDWTGRWTKLIRGIGVVTTGFALSLGLLRLTTVGERTGEIRQPRFHWIERAGGDHTINSIVRGIHQYAGADDPIIIFCWHDYLYLAADRMPTFGYLYTWYPAFHDREIESKVIGEIEHGKTKVLITRSDDPFALAFVDRPRETEIYKAMLKHFRPISNYRDWAELILWVRLDPGEDQVPASEASINKSR